MKKTVLPLILLALFLVPCSVFAQQDSSLRAQIAQIAKQSKGVVGVSVLGIESRDTVNYNGNSHMVMHSVMKFPIAMTILHLVDKGKYKLDQMFKVSKKNWPGNSYSPLRQKYPEGGSIALSEFLSYMVSLSDNDACDFMLKKIGGPKAVEEYIQSIGIKGIMVNASEGEMAAAWEVQYTNWCKPTEVVHLLDIFYQGKGSLKNK